MRNNRDAETLSTTPEASPPGRWHSLSIPAALAAAQTGMTGLSDAAAAARLVEFGPNRLESAKPISAARILRDQLSSVVVFLLAVAAAISATLEDYLEAFAIVAVLVINTVIGFATEWRARRAMEALRGLDVPRASVVRNGQLRIIDAESLVPGDLIEVSVGQRVPADAINYLGSKFRSFGINSLEMVSQTFASWNQIAGWLRRLDGLRGAA